MKLITLNIWGGHVKGPLLDFVKKHADTDIFCLQEVYHNAPNLISNEARQVSLNIFSELQELLPDSQAYFRPTVQGIYGIGMLVNKKLQVMEEGEVSIHHNPEYNGRGPEHSRNMQWMTIQNGQNSMAILNVHGLWNGKGKTDTPARLAQSQQIRQFMDTLQMPKILCGDFNLRPDTESLKILDEGMHNLVQMHGVQSTRTSLYPKVEKFADYIFTSPEITVKHFEVLPDEVSDHSPLLLNFEAL